MTVCPFILAVCVFATLILSLVEPGDLIVKVGMWHAVARFASSPQYLFKFKTLTPNPSPGGRGRLH